MKQFSFIFSCLVACVSVSLSGQANLGPVNAGSNTTTAVTVTFITPGTLNNIYVSTAGAPNRDFTNAGGGTCATGTPYAAKATCTVEVKFAPTTVGARYGAILLTNYDGSIATTEYLQGTGDGPRTSFLPATPFYPLTEFYNPTALAVDSDGGVYAAEGLFTPIHDGSTNPGYLTSNVGFYASEFYPAQIAVDGAGNVYTREGPYVRQSNGGYGLTNSLQTADAIDGAGNLYRSCTAGVCKETLQSDGTYVESTVAAGLAASRVAVDGSGNVYLATATGVYKFSPSGGSYTQSTIYTGTPNAVSVAGDGLGNVYFMDTNGAVSKETLQSDGSYVKTTVSTGIGIAYAGLAADSEGNAYFFAPDGRGQYGATNGVLEEDSSIPPTLTFASTQQGSSTGTQVVTITNSGNAPLQFSEVAYPADFPESSTGVTDCTAATTLAPNASCTLTIKFAPVSSLNGNPSGLLTESIAITTNTRNAPSTQQSITVTGTETLSPAATPTFSLPAGVYYTTQTVAISDATPGATIYYTLNGSQPTISSYRYIRPVAINAAETIKAIAVAPGLSSSSVASAYYALTAPTPVITPAGGTYSGSQTVTISTSTPIEAIFYTTAGNQPTTSSAHYTGPITVSSTENVIAFAAQTGFISSPMVSQRFTIAAPAAAPVLSLASGTYTSSQTVTITDATHGAAIYYTLDGTAPSTSSTPYSGAITIASTTTLRAIAVASGYAPSSISTATYTISIPPGTLGNFGSVNIGSSTTGSVTLTLSTAGTIGSVTVGSGGATNLDFTQLPGGTCAVGSTFGSVPTTCTVYVAFQPLHAGARYGSVVVKDTQNNPIGVSNIHGTGNGPQTSFMPGKETDLGFEPEVTRMAVDGNRKVYMSLRTYNNGSATVPGGLVTLTPNGAGGYTKSVDTSETDLQGVWTDLAGNLYIYDSVKGLSKNGLPILPGVQPLNLAGDAAGNLFIVESDSKLVLKETLQPGGTYIQSTLDLGIGGYYGPNNIWMDGAGNLYVDQNSHTYKETLQPGGGYTFTFMPDFAWTEAVDEIGDLYGFKAAPPNNTITFHKKTIQADGSYVDSQVQSSIANPGPFAADWLGGIYFADNYSSYYDSVTTEDFTQAPSLTFASTQLNSTSSDSPKKVTISNSGTTPLQFTSVTYPTDFPESSTATGDCTASTSLAPGASCTLTITFAPVTPLSNGNPSALLTESVTITTNTLNAPSTTQSITVTGTETN